jgi:signal transduction histidine kinase/serine phosphatase RsbU (regulator of sigma subunit)/DNA-binding NarL/FixJ family response regulator
VTGDRAELQPGEMAARIDAFDWSTTPLGARDNWSPALVTTLDVALASRFPMILWWGPELVLLYNDAYAPMLGAKHPGALGQPGVSPQAWGEPEIRSVIEPMLRGVLEHGDATWSEDQMLELDRRGFLEETYFTWSYSPVREHGAIVGVFTAVSETTGTVIHARRLRVLSDLTAATFDAPSAADACCRASEVLVGDRFDIPFHSIHLCDDDATRSVAAAGIDGFGDADAEWLAARAGSGPVVVDVGTRGWQVQHAVWPEPGTRAVVLPLSGAGEQRRLGFACFGTSPRLALDDDYLAFLELIATRIASAIADARALEDERRRAAAVAELERSKTVFFSTVSHEFRTPLTLMLGPLEDALGDPDAPLPPAQRERVEHARANGLRMLKLVNSLLDFSRVEAGRLRTTAEPADLALLTADLVSVFESAFASAGLHLDVEIDPIEGLFDVDVEMWETIVFNLLSNALKYTQRGGARVTLQRHDGVVEFCVADTGVGIAAGEIERIFDRFYRSQNVAGRSMEGTGIGLALVRELARLHGGDVSVESAPGAGAAFTVSVPFRVSDVAATEARSQPAPSVRAQSFLEEARRWLPDAEPLDLRRADDGDGTSAAASPLPRVLVVDDNADMRRYLRQVLAPAFDVMLAANGGDAIAAAKRERPDVVVSDIMMPVLDGVALTQALRSDPSLDDVPVLLLSARAGAASSVDAFAGGADDYLVKPFSARELVARVQALLDASRRNARTVEREQRRRAMTEVVADLASALNTATSMQDVADAIARVLGEGPVPDFLLAALAVLEPSGDTITQYYGGTLAGDLQVRYRRMSLDVDAHATRVVRDGTFTYLADAAEQTREFPDLAPDIRSVGSQACALLPLTDAAARTIGGIVIAFGRPYTFDREEDALFHDIAAVVSRTVERVQVYELERSIARSLQLGLLAVDVRCTHAVVRARYLPSDASLEIGGDWYDVVDIPDGRLALAVGDVVGRGLAAATTMGQLRAALGMTALQATGPVDALDALERFAEHVPGASCATVAFAIVDPVAASLSYSCAGHPPPLLVSPEGDVRYLEGSRSWPLGAGPPVRAIEPAAAPFPAGALLLLYTDGLVERRGESIAVGLERLRDALRQCWYLPVGKLTREITRVMLGDDGHYHDDVALVAVRAVGACNEIFSDVYPAVPSELAASRVRLRDWLGARGLDHDACAAALVAIGEACANAIDHGSKRDDRQTIAVEVSARDGALVATVSDSGTWQTGLEGFFAGRGRGHTLMQALADDVTIETGHQGTSVTLRLGARTRV